MKKLSLLGILLVGITFGCVEVKQNQLYVEKETNEPEPFHPSEDIYRDYLTSEAWHTISDECLEVKAISQAAKEGDLGLHIKWDRVKLGCPWLGLGFGWDNWTGKDLYSIKNTGALQFYVKMPKGERTSLPWAIGFEDFTGAQAWLGMNGNAIKGEKITDSEWTRIELPLSEFNWEEMDADVSNIKQLIMQFEADGEIYLDEIQLVPYYGGYRKRASIYALDNGDKFETDGQQNDVLWKTEPVGFSGHEVHLGIKGDTLCIAAWIKDETPGQNTQDGREIYNGDAFEIAFSTDDRSAIRRNNYRTTDYHFAIRASESPIVYDFRKDERAAYQDVSVYSRATNGYWLEAKIYLDLGKDQNLEIGDLFGLELAVDQNVGNRREVQQRWNNPEVDGFNERPSLWGEMLVKRLERREL